MPFIYAFDHKHRRAPMSMKDLLGGKGANLAEMMSVLKLPVPHGFTVTTDACRAYMKSGWPKTLDKELATHVAQLEKRWVRVWVIRQARCWFRFARVRSFQCQE